MTFTCFTMRKLSILIYMICLFVLYINIWYVLFKHIIYCIYDVFVLMSYETRGLLIVSVVVGAILFHVPMRHNTTQSTWTELKYGQTVLSQFHTAIIVILLGVTHACLNHYDKFEQVPYLWVGSNDFGKLEIACFSIQPVHKL